MKKQIDSIYHIGSSHDVCEDYANHDQFNSYVIISDGCSSAMHSDTGARILTNIISKHLYKLPKKRDVFLQFNIENCIHEAQEVITQHLLMPNECLFATSLFLKNIPGFIWSKVIGDGHIIIITHDDVLIDIKFSYVNNLPFYLNYLYNNENDYQIWQNQKDNIKIQITAIVNGNIENLFYQKTSSKSNESISINNKYFEANILKKDWNIDVLINPTNIKNASITSDGIETYYKIENGQTFLQNVDVNYVDILPSLFNFKNHNNGFLQRRFKRFSKNNIKNNIYHRDDIAIGTMIL